MTMQIIPAVAEFEHDLLIERTYSDIVRAKTAGKRFGCPPDQDEQKLLVAFERINSSISSIAREFSTTRQTILHIKEASLLTSMGD
ncbi:resolvase [Pantoea agglomerans]|nr:resolvase [Pantoea agglomerans]